ncbi:enoyl-CoA hydratase/isomerase family protein [Actinoplanes sp. HUAS TT8]|uniref:enoyl-CoA hydratase/isomerase family protein n=1 Tax=Actinoplanes sp. HUAS TT8 TaxID=3447453 RepID=UPI003F52602B
MVVDYEYADGIARIFLNRPERLNAVTPPLVDGVLAGLARAEQDAARVVILAGRGRSFCAGHDLKEPTPVETVTETRQRLERIQDVTRRIRTFPGVVVAAVHGYALGAGCEFALACDFVVADEQAQFGFPEVGVGLSVTGGISQLLPHLVGLAKARELLLLGDRITAPEALAIGMIHRVGPHEQVAAELAARLVERPQGALQLAKRVLDLGLDGTLETALAVEVEHALITSLAGEHDKPREEFSHG